jgi:hypothetical protein
MIARLVTILSFLAEIPVLTSAAVQQEYDELLLTPMCQSIEEFAAFVVPQSFDQIEQEQQWFQTKVERLLSACQSKAMDLSQLPDHLQSTLLGLISGYQIRACTDWWQEWIHQIHKELLRKDFGSTPLIDIPAQGSIVC